MKKSLILASCLLASSSVMAMDLEYFLGAGAERGSIDLKKSSNGTDEGNERGKDMSPLLKMGAIIDNKHRISLSYNKLSKDISDEYTDGQMDKKSILCSYDYLIPMGNNFKLYTGVHAGDTKVSVEYDGDKTSFSGLAYGAQIGTLYDITKNVEFELALGYTKYNVDKAEEPGRWFKMELDKSTSMYAGINYKF